MISSSAVTELAYLPDLRSAYVRTFRARVTALPPGAVVLDRTYFYPAGGGQPCDRGSLRLPDGTRVPVVDVVKSGASVLHRVKASPASARALAVGMEVEGSIDWERRHRHMRLHTAQHLLSAQVFARTRLRTRKANLHGTRATIDLEGPLPEGAHEALFQDLRAALDERLPVSIRHVPRAEWDRNPASERSGLVPLPVQVDPVRVVEIRDTDVCPCGGTHVRSTDEIGPVRLEPPTRLEDGASRVAFTLEDAVRPTPSA
jgi:misacylated tRNA(Ala) deacylase